ncbi:nucleotidyltransferase family protein [Thermodesulfobacteriota bacterium]
MQRKALLLHCIKGMIRFEDRFDLVKTGDVKWICERLTWHKIMPMAVAMNNPEKPKCPPLEQIFRDISVKAAFRVSDYEEQVASIFKILTGASIDFTPYKGPFWTQRIYPDYTWRHIGDVDLFLSKEDARNASSLLKERGYKPVIVKGSEDEDFRIRGELTFYPDASGEHKFPVQLHWALLPSHRFVNTDFIRGEDLTHGATSESWKGIPCRLPSPEIRFLYYILHATCQHQFNRFIHVMTMAHMIQRCQEIDWDLLHHIARDRGALVPLYYGLTFIHAFLPLPDPVRTLMHSIIPSAKVRLGAAGLYPYGTLMADKKRGKLRRKLFRIAMTW